jgi:hypothetical protein
MDGKTRDEMDHLTNFLTLNFKASRRFILAVWYIFLFSQLQNMWQIFAAVYVTIVNLGGMRNLDWYGISMSAWIIFNQAGFFAWIGIVAIVLLAAQSILENANEK